MRKETALNSLYTKRLCGASGLAAMKIIAAATLTLLLAAFTAQALTPTPIDAQPYGPVSDHRGPPKADIPFAVLTMILQAFNVPTLCLRYYFN